MVVALVADNTGAAVVLVVSEQERHFQLPLEQNIRLPLVVVVQAVHTLETTLVLLALTPCLAQSLLPVVVLEEGLI